MSSTTPKKKSTTPKKVETHQGKISVKELEKALKNYDTVCWIKSLEGITQGWILYGDTKLHRGRVVSVIGSFKVGKTFITRKLLEDDSLVDSAIIPTLGISMKLKKRFGEKSPPETQKEEEGEEGEEGEEESIFTDTVSDDDEEAIPIYELIMLDTQGTNTPCDYESLSDVRATECFLRDMILELSQRPILVIGKFDKSAMVDISALAEQLHNKSKSVSINNRLLIVHNYQDVMDRVTLENRISAVGNSYKKKGWEQLKQEFPVFNAGQSDGGHRIPPTTHLFLMNDEKGSDQNNKVIEYLRSVLVGADLVDFDLVNQLKEKAQMYLPSYLLSWEYDLVVKREKNRISLVPEIRTQDKGTGEFEKKQKLSEQQLKQILDKKEKLKLQELDFTDTGVRSASIIELEGSFCHDQENNLFQVTVHVPGLTPDKKSDDWINIFLNQNHRKVDILVKMEEPRVNLRVLKSTIKYGDGIYSYTLPESLTYRFPPSKKDLLTNSVVIDNGKLTLTLLEDVLE